MFSSMSFRLCTYQGLNFEFLHVPGPVLLDADLPDAGGSEQSNHLLKPLWKSWLFLTTEGLACPQISSCTWMGLSPLITESTSPKGFLVGTCLHFLETS